MQRSVAEQRHALIVAYTSRLLARSRRHRLTVDESRAIAGCLTIAEALRVVEARRTPIPERAIPVSPVAPRRVERFRDAWSPVVHVLRQVMPYLPIVWTVR